MTLTLDRSKSPSKRLALDCGGGVGRGGLAWGDGGRDGGLDGGLEGGRAGRVRLSSGGNVVGTACFSNAL